MADYTRTPQRFFFTGLSLLPQDTLAPGKFPYLRNVRSYEEGTIQPRYGLTRLNTVAALGSAVQTILRLNDTTPAASVPALRFVKTLGGSLFAAAPAATNYGAAVDTGYSANPVMGVVTQPVLSPQPWLYIGDSSRMRKCNVNGAIYQIGIAPPQTPPVVAYGAPGVTVISDLDTAADWTQVGTIAAAPSDIVRVNTTISAIAYDSGTTGYASIGATSMANIGTGVRVTLAGAEDVLVTDTLIAIASTTIAAIAYDAGTSGACVIQPAASLGTGQLDGPAFADYLNRYTNGSSGDPMTSPLARVRQVDFPVNCLVTINSGGGSAETIRITSVALGPDGIQSFRCVTANTHAAGESLTGVAGFRAYTVGTRAAGNSIGANAIQQVLTTTTTAPAVGGINDTTLAANLSLVAGRATLPDDYLHISFKADLLTYVTEVRLMLDVNLGGVNFLDNYYMATWRANDIVSAIQSTNAQSVATLQDARQEVVLQNQIDQPVTAVSSDVNDPYGVEDKPYFNGYQNTPYNAPIQSGQSTALSATAAQLALGNNQWIELKTRVADLTRIGTDPSRTLANVAGVQILVSLAGYTGAVTCAFDSAWIQGGYGADTGDTGTPYVYCYRYRSSLTGARSNPSPPSRGGVMPRRQRINVTPTASADAQADLVDYFRFGGQLTRWTYTGTSPISSGLADDNSDGGIDGGEGLRFDLFQPWPTVGQPAFGTGTIVGTTLVRTGGDTFSTSWAPGTAITVNGFTTTLYASPTSTSRVELATNCGSGTGVTWSVKEPIVLAQKLPGLWGGPINGVIFLFGCGDPTDPGSVHWTHGNDPDATSDANWLPITSATEPLQSGFVYDGVPFVFSTDNLYRLDATFGEANAFRAMKTPCGRGLWSRWAFCVSPRGVYFLAKDGIYFSAFGGEAVCISDPDLRQLFPQEGADSPAAVNGIDAPDLGTAAGLQLAYVGGYVYFDYLSDNGYRTLMYEEGNGQEAGRWHYDQYLISTVRTRAWEPGSAVNDQILGATDGYLYQYDPAAVTDAGTTLDWDLDTPWATGGDVRLQKQFGDATLDLDPNGSVQGVTVTPVYSYGQSTLTPVVIGAGVSVRTLAVIDWSAGGGVLSVNAGLRLRGHVVSGDTDRPVVFGWEPSFLPKAANTLLRATDWDNLGYQGAKFVQGIVIRANTYGVDKTVAIQGDGATQLTLTINHNGELTKAYPLESAGWTPFIAELVRMLGTDTDPWQLLDARWVWEPAPELATQWQVQPTSQDMPGYFSVRDLVVGYSASADVTLVVAYNDGPTQTYTLASTSGAYTRAYVVMAAGKGRAVTYTFTSASPFRLYKRDMAVRTQPWGAPSGYLALQPFGGPSRADGAAI